MTYYEWVMLFDEIKKSPRNDKYLEKLKTLSTSYEGNAKTLFVNHILDVINTRLKNTLDSFLNKARKTNFVIESLLVELNEIKKEVNYLRELISYSYVPDDKRIELKNYLNTAVRGIEESIKKSFDGNTNSQIVLMVKNLNLMEVNNELQ